MTGQIHFANFLSKNFAIISMVFASYQLIPPENAAPAHYGNSDQVLRSPSISQRFQCHPERRIYAIQKPSA